MNCSTIFRFFLSKALVMILPGYIFSQAVVLDEFAGGFTRPCEIIHAGDERLFVVEQIGKIKILLPDGSVLEEPFLDIDDRVNAQGNGMGLLGLAFPPNYCSSGSFYVNYTYVEANMLYVRISRFAVSDFDVNVAVPGSEEVLMQIQQPFITHNGCHMEFGPDGYLYIGMGDGGSEGDPFNNAQSLNSHLGKILRIDVSTQPYTIPADNPFINDETAHDEIWAYGLRNPWKYAFDKVSGDLFIADVGQENREEVNHHPAEAQGGTNYGWRCYEGTEPYGLDSCEAGEYVAPVFDYAYGENINGFRCSITGGRIYRGASFPNFYGKYFFSDYCSPEYWFLWKENDEWVTFTSGGFMNGIVSYGEDVFGEMYAVHGSDGMVYRVREEGEAFLPHIQTNGNVLVSMLEGESYTWYLNGVMIEGENSILINAAESGNYVVHITSASGCTVTTGGIDFVISTAADHILVRSFEIFPNPAIGTVWVEAILQTAVNDLRVDIYSLDGKKVLSHPLGGSERTEIDLSTLAPGIYFTQLIGSKEYMAVRKVIRQ